MSVVSPDHILRLGYAYRDARTLLSAVELGVFTALAAGPLDLTALTDRIKIDRRGAQDFFDSLVALGLLCRDAFGHYTCTPETAHYLDRQKPSYLGSDLEFNAQLYARWNLLTRALKTGKPQNAVGTKGNYPALYTDPAALEVFVRAMTAATLSAAKAMAATFAWSNYRTIIDVGSAEGCLPVEVARVHPHLTGGGFDLPPLKSAFDRYVQNHRLAGRLRFYPGDFFHDPLPTADVMVMGRVLHNWDLATKKMLLRKVHEALPAQGVLIVYERLIDNERKVNVAGLLSSLNMLVMTEGGFDFTGADCIGWMRETGFRDLRLEPLAGDQSMIVGAK